MILEGVLKSESTLSAFDLRSSWLIPHRGHRASIDIWVTQRRGNMASDWHCAHRYVRE
jgi:hypothetical protein